MKHVLYARWYAGLWAIALSRLLTMAMLPLADTTEARYGFVTRLMVNTNNWVTPFFQHDIPFWGKPPLSFWMQALSAKALGMTEFALRLPAWGVTLLIGMLVYTLARTLKYRFSGIIAALCFATMGLSYFVAGGVMTDMYFTLGYTLSVVSLAMVHLKPQTKGWGIAFFVGIAIGLLAKGPLILALLILALLGWKLLAKGHASLKVLPWGYGSVLALVLAAPWYMLAEHSTPGFLNYFIVGEHIRRFIQPGWTGDLYGDGHSHAPGTIWLYTLIVSLPVLPLFLLLKYSGLQRFKRCSSQYSILLLVASAALAPIVLFTPARNIITTYVLPALPFIAVGLAMVATPYLHRNRKAAMVLFALTPCVATGIMVYMSVVPGTIRTEKPLIQAYHRSLKEHPSWRNAPFYFADQLPYSAQYYSNDATQLLPLSKVLPLSNTTPTPPYFLAVVNDNCQGVHAALNGLPQIIAYSKGFCLIQVSPQHP